MNPKIQIVKTNYVNFHAEAIVNSANDMLVVGSNVAGQLGNAAGPEYEKTLKKITKDRDMLPFELGKAIYTPSFNAGKKGVTKYIIHAISLGSRIYAPKEGRLLATVHTVFSAVRNALKLADELKCKSIIYPVMLSRPGYSVVDIDSMTLRWVMATTLILGIKSCFNNLKNIENIYISVFNKDENLIEYDDKIFSILLRESNWGQLNKPY